MDDELVERLRQWITDEFYGGLITARQRDELEAFVAAMAQGSDLQ